MFKVESLLNLETAYKSRGLAYCDELFWWVAPDENFVANETEERFSYPPEAYSHSVQSLGRRGIAYRENLDGYRISNLDSSTRVKSFSGDNPVFSSKRDLVLIDDRDSSYNKVPILRSLSNQESIVELAGGNSAKFSWNENWIIAREWMDNCNSSSGTRFFFAQVGSDKQFQLSCPEIVNGRAYLLDNERAVAQNKNGELTLLHFVDQKLETKEIQEEFSELLGSFANRVVIRSSSYCCHWLDGENFQSLFETANTIKLVVSPAKELGARIHFNEEEKIQLEVFSTKDGQAYFRQLLESFSMANSEDREHSFELLFDSKAERLAYLDRDSFRTWSIQRAEQELPIEIPVEKDPMKPKDAAFKSEEKRSSSELDYDAPKSGFGGSLFRVGSFLLSSAKQLLNTVKEAPQNAQEQPGPYPEIWGLGYAPSSPQESINMLKQRLRKLREFHQGDLPEVSSEAQGLAKNLIELQNLEPFWQMTERSLPPYELDWEQNYAFNLANTNYQRLIEKDLDAQVELFGFLELLSRANPSLRPHVSYLLSNRLKPYKEYLQRSTPKLPEAPVVEVPSVSWDEVNQSLEQWILPRIKNEAKLDDKEFEIAKSKLTRDLSTIKNRLTYESKEAGQESYQMGVIASALKEELIDPDDLIPKGLQEKLELAFKISLEPEYCKRCNLPQKSAWMKTGTICWGCWDN